MCVCVQFGGILSGEVEVTAVSCSVLEGVECSGNRTFFKTGVPCLRFVFIGITVYSIELNIECMLSCD